MHIPAILKSNPFRDLAADSAAGNARASEFECGRCRERVAAINRGAAPRLLALPASLFADVADSAGGFCRDCARNINVLGAFGLLLLVGELAIVVADLKKYF